MADANLLGYLGIILTVLVVGIALGGLMLKMLQETNRRIDDTNRRIEDMNRRIDDTNQRIDELSVRFVELEKSVARLEGYMAGMQTAGSQAAS